MSRERRRLPVDVQPLDVDGSRAVAVGTLLWALAFVVLLVFFRDDLAQGDREWWLWTSLAGAGLGLVGWEYTRHRRSGQEDYAQAVEEVEQRRDAVRPRRGAGRHRPRYERRRR